MPWDGGALAVRVDVGDEAQVEALARAVEREFGSIRLLVNNAGILGGNKPFAETTIAEWDETLRVNLRGPFL